MNAENKLIPATHGLALGGIIVARSPNVYGRAANIVIAAKNAAPRDRQLILPMCHTEGCQSCFVVSSLSFTTNGIANNRNSARPRSSSD